MLIHSRVTKPGRKQVFLLVFLLPAFLYSNPWKDPDTIVTPNPYYRYAGIQANLLLQQFISFNSNTSINSNPYVFSYAKNNIQTGSGFAFGTGFNISENSTNDGVSSVNVQNINITFRVGYERKYLQKQRLIPFWGIDFGAGGVYNKVTSSLNQSFNSNATTVETTKIFMGPSFRGGLLVALNKHILLGTEFFFNSQIAFTQTNSGTGASSSFIPFNMGFQVPTALFLTFRY
jgi:hypothetical protein